MTMNIEMLRELLSDDGLLTAWVVLALGSCSVLIYDLRRHNSHIATIMKAVWLLTVLYSGPLGLLIYYFSGRRQIRRDSLWRKGFRSVAHCYSGCGAGEITGVLLAVGLLSLGNTGTALLTFTFAYVFGYGMTLGPLLQGGTPLKQAMIDTFYSDTATIAVMEVSAISIDLWLAAAATPADTLFWSSLVLSLTAGLVVAYPVNVALVYLGVKSGMANPRETTAGAGGHAH
jgi:hypothetical protein